MIHDPYDDIEAGQDAPEPEDYDDCEICGRWLGEGAHCHPYQGYRVGA